jgi:hypothetical protein
MQGGATSLSLAAGNGHESVVRLLLDSKAKANLTDQVSALGHKHAPKFIYLQRTYNPPRPMGRV